MLSIMREADPEAKLPRWRLHDLRRVARSLMSRAGVPREDAERALGHQVGGALERTYDRHDHARGRLAAMDALAKQIDAIVRGEAASPRVIEFRSQRG
jgi:integrase